MVTRKQDHIYMVINAGCKDKDLKHLGAKLKEFNEKNKADVRIEELHKEWSEHNHANHAHAHAHAAVQNGAVHDDDTAVHALMIPTSFSLFAVASSDPGCAGS
jgi:hypothetical protein